MKSANDTTVNPGRLATADDVRHVLGGLEDVLIAHILAVQPTYQELAEAAIWARGDGDLLARESKDLSAGALAVASLIAENDEAAGEDASAEG